MRSISSDFRTQLSAALIRPRILIDLETESSTLYIWNGVGAISYSGNDYSECEYYMGMSSYHETSDVQSEGVSINLSGDASGLIAMLFLEFKPGLSLNTYLGFVDENNEVIAAASLFKGILDTVQMKDSGDAATITLNYETELIMLEGKRDFRYNSGTQKAFYADDKGFEYVEQMSQWDGFWGKKPSKAPDSRSKKNKKKTGK